MELMVFGATGGTGRRLIDQAIADGHSVTALARRPEAIERVHERLEVLGGDVLSSEEWRDRLHPDVVVLSALGVGSSRRPDALYSRGTASIASAMRSRAARRIVVLSAAPVAPVAETNAIDRRVLHPIVRSFFGEVYADMARMEALLAESGLEWTALRPPRLTDGRPTGRYRTAVGEPLPRARSISRADLARAMLQSITDRSLVGRSAAVAA